MANKTARVRASIKDSIESTDIFQAWERKKRAWARRGPNNRPLNGARVGQYHLKDDTSIRTISRRVSMEIGLDKQAERQERLARIAPYEAGRLSHGLNGTKADIKKALIEAGAVSVKYSGARNAFHVVMASGEQGWFDGFFRDRVKLHD